MQRKAAGKEIQNPEQHEGIFEDISVRVGIKYEYTSIAYFQRLLRCCLPIVKLTVRIVGAMKRR